jgi:polyhydroxyalkanoate synthesis regulator phasin
METIKNAISTSLGAVLLTRNKIEETLQTLIKEAKISESDAKQLGEELIKKGETQLNALNEAVKSAIDNGMCSIDIENNESFQSLIKKMQDMDNRIRQLEVSDVSRRGRIQNHPGGDFR